MNKLDESLKTLASKINEVAAEFQLIKREELQEYQNMADTFKDGDLEEGENHE